MELTSCWFLWLTLITIPVLLYFLIIKRSNKLNLPLPPGPTPLPIIGSLLELGNMPHRSLALLAKTYGPVMSLKLGRITNIIVSSPDAAREVLQTNDQSLSARSVQDAVRFAKYHTASVVWTDPSQSQWKNVRAIMRSQLMSPQTLSTHEDLRQHKVKQMIAHIQTLAEKGQTVDVGRAAFGATLNLLSCTIFSVDFVDLNSEVGHEFKELMWSIMEGIGRPNLSDFFPLLAAVDPQGYKRKMGRQFETLFQMFDKIIDQRFQKDTGRKGSSDVHDILDELLVLETHGKLDRQTTKSMLADSFIAGSDTTSITVEWAMAELLRNPNAMTRARAELAAVIGADVELCESDISKLPFLQSVVKETFRIHPPGPLLIPHRASTNAELCGYFVPKGSRVIVNAWAIGHDESVWKDAECFRPERFLDAEVDYRGRHFELIPFGSGRRICPGLPLAHRMVHLILGSLLNSFEWKLPAGMRPIDVDLTEKFGLTLALASPPLAKPVPLKD